MELIIDEKIRDLLPPMTDDEYRGLEHSILCDGFDAAFPVIVWKGKGILVDGYARVEICNQYGIDFTSIEHEFMSEHDVYIFRLDSQLNRKSLNKKSRAYLVGKKYLMFGEEHTDIYKLRWIWTIKKCIKETNKEISDLSQGIKKITDDMEDHPDAYTLEDMDRIIEKQPEQREKMEALFKRLSELCDMWDKVSKINDTEINTTVHEPKIKADIPKTEPVPAQDLKSQLEVMKLARQKKAGKQKTKR
ncbi:hypothetical protein [Methanosarcina sp.]|uniref:hypothetical protein n=1 Tax=Methanosarcina sp. TaxID=2213 RepID=UPI002BE99AC9|nr:hypothetical protein [Methanosarcina sp.]HOW15048.1 hypothetical protein [Methanosarcina sp.]